MTRYNALDAVSACSFPTRWTIQVLAETAICTYLWTGNHGKTASTALADLVETCQDLDLTIERINTIDGILTLKLTSN